MTELITQGNKFLIALAPLNFEITFSKVFSNLSDYPDHTSSGTHTHRIELFVQRIDKTNNIISA